MKIDCHSHTTFSDGSLTPIALLNLAKENQLAGLSITDHDTIGAYETAIPYAEALGIQLIPGIEISSEYQKANVHVLGYAFDVHHPALSLFCEQLQQRRIERNTAILERLTRQGIRITQEMLEQRFPLHVSLGRPHIATLLFEKGFVRSPQQAFTRYIGEKCKCYVSDMQISTLEAIAFLHSINAFAVLAHPHYLPKSIIPALSEMPFDGIEAFSGRSHHNAFWLDLAEKKGWFITGGSDFHGPKKAHQPLGCAWAPLETVERFCRHGFVTSSCK